MMAEKAKLMRVEEVENGFTTSVTDYRSNPAKETVHIFDTYADLVKHILKHFGFAGRVVLESVRPEEKE
jgi:hypothetical protein